MADRSYQVRGIVLKRVNYGEADRIVTFFSKEEGKLTVIARGVRRLVSKKKSSLEPGTLATFFIARTKSLDVLTQTQLENSFASARNSLTGMTQMYQLLEIVDVLTVERQESPEVFHLLLQSLELLEQNGSKKKVLLENIRLILKHLGFTYDKEFSEPGLKKYIEELAQKKLRSKAFLTPETIEKSGH